MLNNITYPWRYINNIAIMYFSLEDIRPCRPKSTRITIKE